MVAREPLRTSTFNLALATGQCATLLQSGLPLATALATIAELTPCRSLREALSDIHARVTAGTYLSQALRAYPSLFSRSYLALVVAGERSGALPNTLARCASWLEADDQVTRRLRAAAAYPLLVLTVALVLTMILFTTFLPGLFTMFADSGTRLPLLTRFMMTATWLTTRWWFWILVVLGLCALYREAQNRVARERWQRRARRAPWLGKLLQMAYLARFSQSLASLLECGLPAHAAWPVAASSSGDLALIEDADRLVAQVRNGATLAEGVRGGGDLYPHGMSGWVELGEETAALPLALRSMGKIYQLEADARTEMLGSLLEPLFVAAMGGFVMLVLVSIMLPLYGNLMLLS